MQQPMDSCVLGINTSSESILIRSYYFSRDKHGPVEFWYTYFTDKTRELTDLKFTPQT